jgi:hypothetical protein
MGSQILVCGLQHLCPKGFHAQCGNVVGPISIIITIHNCIWMGASMLTRAITHVINA